MSREERPRIGITTSPRRGAEYYVPYKRAVEAVGAEPVDLPPGTTSLPNVDGLLLPGGWDVDPALYGEKPDPKVGPIDRELDDTELRLFAQARDQNLPVMGICRGQQVINVAMGGSLQQHLDGHEVRQFGRNHLAHAIEVDPRSELGRAAGDKKIRVNSELATGLAHPCDPRNHARRLVDLHHLPDQPRRNRRLSVCGRDVDKIARLHVADDPSAIASANRQPSSSCLCKRTLQLNDGG